MDEGFDLVAQQVEVGALMEQLLPRGEGRDDEHPVEDIFPVEVIFTPMFFYPGGMLRVDDQFGGGDDGVPGKHFGFDPALRSPASQAVCRFSIPQR